MDTRSLDSTIANLIENLRPACVADAMRMAPVICVKASLGPMFTEGIG